MVASVVDRISMSVHEIADCGLTLSKLSVAASLLGDVVKQWRWPAAVERACC
jgi:hypothetical protein